MSPRPSIPQKENKRLDRIFDSSAKESFKKKIIEILGLDPEQRKIFVSLFFLAVFVVLAIVTMTQLSNFSQWGNLSQLSNLTHWSDLTHWNNNNSQVITTNQTEDPSRNYSNSKGPYNLNIKDTTLTVSNKDELSLASNSGVKIGRGMYLKVANTNADAQNFYVCKEITEPEANEIRGQTATGNGDFTWTADNFAGFTYDVKKNVSTESLKVSSQNSGKLIPVNGLTYTTAIKTVNYESGLFSGSYPMLGLFGEAYVPLKPNDPGKLAKLILDSKDMYTLFYGQVRDLGQGYKLKVAKIDVEGKKVWLEFYKDEQKVDEQVVSTDTGSDKTWICNVNNILGEDSIPVLKVHVYRVFINKPRSMAQIDGLWLIDYKNAFAVNEVDVLN